MWTKDRQGSMIRQALQSRQSRSKTLRKLLSGTIEKGFPYHHETTSLNPDDAMMTGNLESKIASAYCVGQLAYSLCSVNYSDMSKWWVSVSPCMHKRADSTYLWVYYTTLWCSMMQSLSAKTFIRAAQLVSVLYDICMIDESWFMSRNWQVTKERKLKVKTRNTMPK